MPTGIRIIHTPISPVHDMNLLARGKQKNDRGKIAYFWFTLFTLAFQTDTAGPGKGSENVRGVSKPRKKQPAPLGSAGGVFRKAYE